MQDVAIVQMSLFTKLTIPLVVLHLASDKRQPVYRLL